ncbi:MULTISPECIES: hypothetical protein [Alteromonadaceae]|uniref:hypothetical protein n=1 Tax=Alteromonadaceae TaxID=72275 RepID=UPI001C08938A|nr:MULTISPECIES: hypothetical protein [Aliiglaciecola]MBU2877177.1 hypothetical protein [Aliiglaciecola lipolytica]MDO6712107.1 hypothetical protein [Aliiglaciecola sp. 2_MG-2023]MDO6753187.1 hypothetical protein [Aliiglaciecola sp. 1_MG-2023]
MKKAILISAFVLASSSVYAQEDKISILDTDADGRISVEEAASDPALSAVFAELDMNKDGYLTPSELAEH